VCARASASESEPSLFCPFISFPRPLRRLPSTTSSTHRCRAAPAGQRPVAPKPAALGRAAADLDEGGAEGRGGLSVVVVPPAPQRPIVDHSADHIRPARDLEVAASPLPLPLSQSQGWGQAVPAPADEGLVEENSARVVVRGAQLNEDALRDREEGMRERMGERLRVCVSRV
jgi:aromatic ring-cleaving dioxygenase